MTFINKLGSVKFFKSYAGPNADVPEGAIPAGVGRPRAGRPDADFDDGQLVVQDNGANDANATLGMIKVVDLFTGHYRLTETNAPIGWVADGDTVLFTIPGANNTADVVLTNPTFTNPRATYPLTVRKIAEDDAALIPGAVFNLYQETTGRRACSWAPTPSWTAASPGPTAMLGARPRVGPGLLLVRALGACAVQPARRPGHRPDPPQLGRLPHPAGVAEFEDPESAIVTAATNGALPAGSISDSATLSGIRQDAGGSIVFRLWANATCSGAPISPRPRCRSMGRDLRPGDHERGQGR